MISGYLIGDKKLIASLTGLPAKMKPVLDATVQRLGYMLQGNVQRNWLRGPRPGRLGIVTGRLANSIAMRFESTATSATATVGTNVPYGVVWEKSGLPARDIFPVKAKALRFEINGTVLFRKHVHVPAQAPRPFLKPALFELRPMVVQQISAALTDVIAAALKP